MKIAKYLFFILTAGILTVVLAFFWVRGGEFKYTGTVERSFPVDVSLKEFCKRAMKAKEMPKSEEKGSVQAKIDIEQAAKDFAIGEPMECEIDHPELGQMLVKFKISLQMDNGVKILGETVSIAPNEIRKAGLLAAELEKISFILGIEPKDSEKKWSLFNPLPDTGTTLVSFSSNVDVKLHFRELGFVKGLANQKISQSQEKLLAQIEKFLQETILNPKAEGSLMDKEADGKRKLKGEVSAEDVSAEAAAKSETEKMEVSEEEEAETEAETVGEDESDGRAKDDGKEEPKSSAKKKPSLFSDLMDSIKDSANVKVPKNHPQEEMPASVTDDSGTEGLGLEDSGPKETGTDDSEDEDSMVEDTVEPIFTDEDFGGRAEAVPETAEAEGGFTEASEREEMEPAGEAEEFNDSLETVNLPEDAGEFAEPTEPAAPVAPAELNEEAEIPEDSLNPMAEDSEENSEEFAEDESGAKPQNAQESPNLRWGPRVPAVR